jgi:hypothetical protein
MLTQHMHNCTHLFNNATNIDNNSCQAKYGTIEYNIDIVIRIMPYLLFCRLYKPQAVLSVFNTKSSNIVCKDVAYSIQRKNLQRSHKYSERFPNNCQLIITNIACSHLLYLPVLVTGACLQRIKRSRSRYHLLELRSPYTFSPCNYAYSM